MIVAIVDVAMTRVSAQLMAKLVTDVVWRTTLLKNVSKLIMIQSHTTGPEVRVTMTSANLVANLKKIFIQLKWILIVKVAVEGTKWRI